MHKVPLPEKCFLLPSPLLPRLSSLLCYQASCRCRLFIRSDFSRFANGISAMRGARVINGKYGVPHQGKWFALGEIPVCCEIRNTRLLLPLYNVRLHVTLNRSILYAHSQIRHILMSIAAAFVVIIPIERMLFAC